MSTLTLWRRDPFADFDQAFDAIVRRGFGGAGSRANAFTPAADIERDGDDAVVRLELPGLDIAKDVTVELADGRLVVKGERRSERTDEQRGHSRREVRYGSFRRSFGLPEHLTADAVTARYAAGVLAVRVAGAYRAPENSATRIAIEQSEDKAIDESPEADEQSA